MTKPNRALSVNASDQRVQNDVASFDHDFAWVCPSQASTGLSLIMTIISSYVAQNA